MISNPTFSSPEPHFVFPNFLTGVVTPFLPCKRALQIVSSLLEEDGHEIIHMFVYSYQPRLTPLCLVSLSRLSSQSPQGSTNRIATHDKYAYGSFPHPSSHRRLTNVLSVVEGSSSHIRWCESPHNYPRHSMAAALFALRLSPYPRQPLRLVLPLQYILRDPVHASLVEG